MISKEPPFQKGERLSHLNYLYPYKSNNERNSDSNY